MPVITHALPEGSEPGVFNVVTLESLGGRPIEGPSDLLDVIYDIRTAFPRSIIAFERNAIDRSLPYTDQGVVNDPGQLGWHIHQGYDTVHISNDSPVPTEIALTIKAVAESILRMLDQFSALRSVSQSFSLAWVTERGTFMGNGPLGRQVAEIRSGLIRIYEGKERDPDVIQKTLDHCRFLLAELGDVGVSMHRMAQENLPAKQRVTLRPREYGAYVIPDGILHARSGLAGTPAARTTEAEISQALTIDRRTGRMQTFEDVVSEVLAAALMSHRR